MKFIGFGFLIDCLHIRAQELANYINVDKSLISKWKCGVRKIDTNSNYFNKIIDFLIIKNTESSSNVLENLFDIDKDVSKDILQQRLKRFIVNNESPSNYSNYTNNYHSCMASVPIYNGSKAKRYAILKMLDLALEGSPCKLIFIYDDVLEFIFNDSDFLQHYTEKILQLLYLGFKLDLIYSFYRSSNIFLYFSKFMFHKNCILYELYSINVPFKYSLHILDKKIAIFGSIANHINPLLENSTKLYNYSAVYSDPISVSVYTQMAISTKEKSNRVFKDIKKEHLFKNKSIETNSLNYDLNNKYYTYYFNYSSPSFTLMSYELFREIVNQSYSSTSQREELLVFYNHRRKFLNEQLKHGEVIHFYPSSSLFELATREKAILGIDNCIINPKLILTKNQMKDFYLDINNLLKTEPNFHICLSSNAFVSSLSTSYGWIIHNNYLVLFDNKNSARYIVSSNPTLLDTITMNFQQIFNYAPIEEKDNFYVSECISSLIIQ